MSDDFIFLVPQDPHYRPNDGQIDRAGNYFKSLTRDGEVEVQQVEKIHFFDAGSNFESVSCPGSATPLDMETWSKWMDDDFDGEGFRLAPRRLSECDDRELTLNDLVYDFPQAFGVFALVGMNMNIGALTADQISVLESELGTALTVVYQHV